MSSSYSNSISDQKSVIASRRGRPSASPARMLAAAYALFAAAESPGEVTMDAVAAAAGVGKGTLFRAFGSRDGLLDALWADRMGALLEAVVSGPPPLGPGPAPQDRAIAFLDALLTFKMANRHLIRAREVTASGLLQSAHYRSMHGLLQGWLREAAPAWCDETASYGAHALLAALHIDLIDELLANGSSLACIREAQADHVRAMVEAAPQGRS